MSYPAPIFNWIPGRALSMHPKATYTRASTGFVTDSSGILRSVASGLPRFDCDPLTGLSKGFLVEESRTNIALYSRDLTNAAWTKTGCTPLKDQTGIDGVGNAASSLEATAPDATCLQTVTLASSARFQSAYVKRLVGSGVVSMTTDGGSTWTAITLTTSWTRVSVPTQTLADPPFGFKIATSGDKIAVDFVQNENGTFETSPIEVTSVAATRAADACTVTLSNLVGPHGEPLWNGVEGTLLVDGDFSAVPSGVTNKTLVNMSDGTSNNMLWALGWSSGGQPSFLVNSGGSYNAQISSGGVVVPGNRYRVAASFNSSGVSLSVNSGSVVTDNSVIMPTVSTMHIGSFAGTSFLNGHIKQVALWNRCLSNADLQALTA